MFPWHFLRFFPPNFLTLVSHSVIVVPGFATAPPSEWYDESGRWLEKLVDNHGRRAQIWTYESQKKGGEISLVQELAEEGQNLLTCLQEFCAGRVPDPGTREQPGGMNPTSTGSRRTGRKPLLFICHSIGGIILKRVRCMDDVLTASISER